MEANPLTHDITRTAAISQAPNGRVDPPPGFGLVIDLMHGGWVMTQGFEGHNWLVVVHVLTVLTHHRGSPFCCSPVHAALFVADLQVSTRGLRNETECPPFPRALL